MTQIKHEKWKACGTRILHRDVIIMFYGIEYEEFILSELHYYDTYSNPSKPILQVENGTICLLHFRQCIDIS